MKKEKLILFRVKNDPMTAQEIIRELENFLALSPSGERVKIADYQRIRNAATKNGSCRVKICARNTMNQADRVKWNGHYCPVVMETMSNVYTQ